MVRPATGLRFRSPLLQLPGAGWADFYPKARSDLWFLPGLLTQGVLGDLWNPAEDPVDPLQIGNAP